MDLAIIISAATKIDRIIKHDLIMSVILIDDIENINETEILGRYNSVNIISAVIHRHQ